MQHPKALSMCGNVSVRVRGSLAGKVWFVYHQKGCWQATRKGVQWRRQRVDTDFFHLT